MHYFRNQVDVARHLVFRPHTALRHLFNEAFRFIGAPAEKVTPVMTRALADAWEDDNGPATWEKVEGYAAGLDDARQLLTPLPHPAIKAVVEGLTQIGRDHGVQGTIFANAVLDARHGRVVASLVFDLWGPDEVPLWIPGANYADRMQARVIEAVRPFGEPDTGGSHLVIDKDLGRVMIQAVFTLKGWNDKPPADEAAAECGRSAPVELTKAPPTMACPDCGSPPRDMTFEVKAGPANGVCRPKSAG